MPLGFRPRKTTTEARRDFQPQQTTKPHEPTHTKKPRTELRVSWRGQVRVISWIVDAAKTLLRKQEHTDLLHRDTVLYAVIERPPVNLIEHGGAGAIHEFTQTFGNRGFVLIRGSVSATKT